MLKLSKNLAKYQGENVDKMFDEDYFDKVKQFGFDDLKTKVDYKDLQWNDGFFY